METRYPLPGRQGQQTQIAQNVELADDHLCTLKTSVGQLVQTTQNPTPTLLPPPPSSKIQSDIKKFNYIMLQFPHKIEIICM